MKIDDVFLTTFSWDVPHGAYPGAAIAYGGERQMGVLTIRTDEGLEGHSFLGSASRDATMDAEALLTYLKPVVMGQNPLDIGRFWHAMWKRRRGVSFRAIGAVDVALWDLAGKIAGLPVHRLLGSCRSSVPCLRQLRRAALRRRPTRRRRSRSRTAAGAATRSTPTPAPPSTSTSAAPRAMPSGRT